MRLSTQLLIGIVGITVLSQTILGLLTYWIVVDVDKQHVLNILQQRTNEVAEIVAIPLVAGEPYDQALAQSRRHFAPSAELALILGQTGIRGIAGPIEKTVNKQVLFKRLLQTKQKNQQNRGELSLGDKNYHWVSTPVAGLPYQLILLDSQDNLQGSIPAILRSRFIASTIVIVWCAVWIALLFGSSISRKLQEKSLAIQYQVTHDAVTGLPNRALLHERLTETIAQSEEHISSVALLVFGINRFREINDTLGHNFGDQLLLETSAEIQQSLPEKGFLCRLSSDELAVILADTTPQQAEAYADHVLVSAQHPVNINDVELKIDFSIGIALFPEHTEDPESLMRYANIAMHQANIDVSQVVLYNKQQEDGHSVNRLILSTELHKAIADGQLILHYQPKVSVATGAVSGLEALVRWEHPTLGLVPPDEFIGLAEQTGAISLLTNWIMEEALFFLRRLHSKGMPLSIAVNVSTQGLRNTHLSSHIMKLLERTGIASHFLTLEITESVMMHDINYAQKILEALHNKGVKISIDDFGTGFSSLAYLNRLPVDELKVDRSFVIGMHSQGNDKSIVQSIIELAHTLNCQVVAEGVEDEKTQALLEGMGCDIVQGYYVGAPLSADAIEQWLEENRLSRLY